MNESVGHGHYPEQVELADEVVKEEKECDYAEAKAEIERRVHHPPSGKVETQGIIQKGAGGEGRE